MGDNLVKKILKSHLVEGELKIGEPIGIKIDQTLTGSDSHTPTAGGVGMLAMGAGGLDVALAMGGGAYYINTPKVCKINLVGSLKPMVAAKDIILEVLRKLTVKGGVNRVFEYGGEGVKTLSVPQRATITNMGAELGATTSIFPSDERTLEYFKAQGRENEWVEFLPDYDAIYDEEVLVNLDELKPLAAKPHSPDNIEEIESIGKIKVDQVAIGSCTNSSYEDLMKVSKILKGKKVHPDVSLVIAPGSRQVMEMMARNGALADIISAGGRILENSCGPCIGMGQAPGSNGVSLRTFNRNFYGRSGTLSANVYLVSPETAAVSALAGVLTDPTEVDVDITVEMPTEFLIDDSMILAPAEVGCDVEVVRGPNIKPFPVNEKLGEAIDGKVLIKVEDNITTDHIMPSNSKLLPFRSNIPYLADFCFNTVDTEFPARAKENNGGFIIAGNNYGQGSSREHAALAPLYLGVKAVIAKSFARIHKANLINNGIIPMEFENEANYDELNNLEDLVMDNIQNALENGVVKIKNVTKGTEFNALIQLTEKEIEVVRFGGRLNYVKSNSN
ncbi:MAG: aconitate hydratase [Clostridium sp.]